MSQGSASQRLRPFRPQPFGRYILLMPLSTGGMGEIFLAQLQGSHGFDKLCVIKKILPHLAQEPDFVSRFIDEAHVLVKLSHGSIAQVLDMGVNDGSPYIALEFVDGKDLRRVVSRMQERNLPLPLSFVLSVMIRVLDALAYAHRKRGDDDADLNLVHRDVSPQNVLISYEGEVKIIDFGLAKSAMSLSKTNPSIVLGKFMYMSPEQARHKPVDRRSDLYSVGLCLWELVVGKNPFEDVPSGELMGKVANPSIPPLNTVEPLCPAALSDAVSRVLAVDPAQRFQTAEELRSALQAILQNIDPLAGSESTSRFMRDAFATEYTAERRMLTTVKEQARALQPDDEPHPADQRETPQGEEETAQNMQSPFSKPGRPPSIPAAPVKPPAAITLDDETPAASRLGALQPEALSFAPTPKAGGTLSNGKKSSVHEKETMPAIHHPTASPQGALQQPIPAAAFPEPPTPVPAQSQQIRARTLAKSFDQESTEASTPAFRSADESAGAIAEPQPMPSIMVDGLPAQTKPSRNEGMAGASATELEVPAQTAPPPSPPPARKPAPAPPKGGTAQRKAVKKANDSQRTSERKAVPKAPATPPPPPQRTDTQIIDRAVADVPPPHLAAQAAAAKPRKGGSMWAWFVIPALALAAVGGYIAWDIYSESMHQKELEEEGLADEGDAPQVENDGAPAPGAEEPAPNPTPKAKDPVVEPAQKPPPAKTPAPVKTAAPAPKKASGTPGQVALRALQADFARLDNQQKFQLKMNELEGQADDKGDDPAFVKKITGLHEQVKAALAKQ
ncbi:MAG: protein kinase [Archangium sp.]|nr:protein kinase [Archangium sp.]